MPQIRRPLTAEAVQKTLKDTPPLYPSFYVCPYADTNPGKPNDYSLRYFPTPEIPCDINLAFITPSDDTISGKFGNTSSDVYLCHLRDRIAIKQFVTHMKDAGRRLLISYIDAPTIHWDKVNIENFVRNTEGEALEDGAFFSNDLMETYQPMGRMWDAETPTAIDMANVMKACFLRGIQRDPDNYVFVYTTYANRDIDAQILTMAIDPTKGDVDKALYDLGFRRIADFITLRGSLSFLETMSYGGDPESRFQEADTYALQYLANGDASKLNEMRKFISIGVAPELTATADAITIASACDPTLEQGYGRFMVWAANCPEGLSLFNAMIGARGQPLPGYFSKEHPEIATLPPQKLLFDPKTSGNRNHFLRFFNVPPGITPVASSSQATAEEEEGFDLGATLNRWSFGLWS